MATLLTTLSKLKIHPAAEIFPMLSDVEIRDLAKDISERGLQNHNGWCGLTCQAKFFTRRLEDEY